MSTAGGTNALRGFLHRHGDSVRSLPEPGEKWLSRDIGVSGAVLNVLHDNGAIEKAGKTYKVDCGEYVYYWRTKNYVYNLAHSPAHTRQDTGLLPCGHDAIKNERGVEGITCGVCGDVHDRAEVDA